MAAIFTAAYAIIYIAFGAASFTTLLSAAFFEKIPLIFVIKVILFGRIVYASAVCYNTSSPFLKRGNSFEQLRLKQTCL